MSPRFRRPLVGQELRLLADRLFTLAKEIADFANEQTEFLGFGEYADLMESEAKLLAYGNLLCASDAKLFLEEEIDSAREHFGYIRQRTGGEL